MRKTYIRPMMNSEEFVTNEYITTCYNVECINGCGSFIKKDGFPTDGMPVKIGTDFYNDILCNIYGWNGTGFEDDGFDYLSASKLDNPSDGRWYYSGTIQGNEGKIKAHNGYYKYEGFLGVYKAEMMTPETVNAHPVDITEITSSNNSTYNCGPNAS